MKTCTNSTPSWYTAISSPCAGTLTWRRSCARRPSASPSDSWAPSAGDCTPQVWLCAIAKRLWYKELERRKRNVPLEEEHLAGQAAPDDPAQETEQREGRLALYRAMQRLDGDTREVIYLRLAGDFSFRDIGDILDRSEVWARVRFYQGKRGAGSDHGR